MIEEENRLYAPKEGSLKAILPFTSGKNRVVQVDFTKRGVFVGVVSDRFISAEFLNCALFISKKIPKLSLKESRAQGAGIWRLKFQCYQSLMVKWYP